MSDALKEDFELVLKKLDQIHEKIDLLIETQREPHVYVGDETAQPYVPEILLSSTFQLK
jgi:uncharacterized protein YpuA (DUF1002 family)